MIIWLNGPFGVGKTQVAHELRERLPGGFVFDPEEIGFALAKVTPRERQTGDFQDLPLWRAFTRQALEDVAVRAQGPVIVPMTLVEPLYFAEVVGVLRASGLEVRHFALLAGREVILRRLRGRLDGPGSWPARQLDRCLEALQDDRFAEHFPTDGRSVEAIAEDIAGRCGLSLEPRSRSRLQAWQRRLRTTLAHVRR